MNYHIHLDKLELSFKTIPFLDSKYFNSSEYHISKIKTDIDYHDSYEVLYLPSNATKSMTLCYINIKHRLTISHSCICMTNKALYTANWLTVLQHLLHNLNLPSLHIKKMEIAIDSNIKFPLKYCTKYLNDKIYYNANYTNNEYHGKMEYKKLSKKTVADLETYYIKSNKKKGCYDRIENKTQELIHSQKNYIATYLGKYIDTSQPIYRFEKTIFSDDMSYSNTKYIEDSGVEISNYMYNKMSEANKLDYNKFVEVKHMNIEISQLQNSNYLTSIFTHFATFNYDAIIKLPQSHFKVEYVSQLKESKKRISKESYKIEEEEQELIEIELRLLEGRKKHYCKQSYNDLLTELFETNLNHF